ncbi:hypothetical protein TA3x_003977 [Tundrisphaera sp. TA3]|uniref:hypothetical protein n=1 Tax=Tundrisphaera sp. TA3 TaxID=3435775 RepID=UPI003EB8585D
MATSTEPGRDRPARRPRWHLTLILLAAPLSGCGQAQVTPGHRELVQKLATGTSTRDPSIIDRAAAEIDGLAAASELNEGEAGAFRAIIEAARAGDWDRAQGLAYALRDGQRPTAEDRERVEKRTLPEIKKALPKRAGRG